MEAEAAAALTPAGGPGTGQKSARSVTEMGSPLRPGPPAWQVPTGQQGHHSPLSAFQGAELCPLKIRGVRLYPETSEGTSLGCGVFKGAIELKCSR